MQSAPPGLRPSIGNLRHAAALGQQTGALSWPRSSSVRLASPPTRTMSGAPSTRVL
jgi:hypothetical protein